MKMKKQVMMMIMMNGKDGYEYKLFLKKDNLGSPVETLEVEDLMECKSEFTRHMILGSY